MDCKKMRHFCICFHKKMRHFSILNNTFLVFIESQARQSMKENIPNLFRLLSLRVMALQRKLICPYKRLDSIEN